MVGVDGPVPLTTIEVELLRYLSARPGRVVPRSELLQNVWGYHASVRSRAVDQAVKRLRRKLELDRTEPQHLLAEHGVGYRLELLPSPVSVGSPGNLTPANDRFVGRVAERQRLDAVVDAGAAVMVLVGPGGVGKSRLATEWARSRSWPGGAWQVALPRSSDDALELLVHDALPGPGTAQERLSALGRALLILDGAEAWVSSLANSVERWRAVAPDLCIVVTSQHRPPLREQVVVEVGGLEPDDARALFEARADAVRHGAAATDPAGVQQLVAHLHGVPLAVELAALRVGVFGPSHIAQRIAADPRVLRGDGRALEATVAWSWSLLPGPEAAFLADLAATFRDGFSAGAVEAVLCDRSIDPLEGLQALRDKSWLSLDATGRLRVVPTLEAFVRERATADPDLQRRHAAHYVEFGGPLLLAPELSGPMRPAAAIDLELENLCHASVAVATAHPQLAGQAALLASTLLGLVTKVRRTLLMGRALQLLDPGPLQCMALRQRGCMRLLDNDRRGGETDLRAAVDTALACDLPEEAGKAWLIWGQTLNYCLQPGPAREVLEGARAVWGEQTDEVHVRIDLELARACCQLGDADAALRCVRRAAEHADHLGDDGAAPIYTAAHIHLELGQLDDAATAFDAVLNWLETHGQPDAAAVLVGVPGEVAQIRGDARAARAYAERSLVATRAASLVVPQRAAEDHVNLARVSLLEGDAATAEEHARSALAVLRHPRGGHAVEIRGVLAVALALQGRLNDARVELSEAARWVPADNDDLRASHRISEALVEAGTGEWGAADRLVEQAIHDVPGGPTRLPIDVRKGCTLLERMRTVRH